VRKELAGEQPTGDPVGAIPGTVSSWLQGPRPVISWPGRV